MTGQNRIVLNNDAFMVIDNAAFVVIENDNPNAITTMGTGGNIISESETDVIQWEIGATTGIYTIPFTTNSGTKIPLIINKTTSGTGATSEFILSTWECSTDFNLPRPTAVSNMNYNSVDKSLFVADRFWHINALSYAIKPDVTLTMNYDPAANELGGLNTIIESNLLAQRFNTNLNHWESTNLFGVNNAANDRVTNINVPSAEFFENWILVDNSNPLPVTLTQFEVSCDETAQHIIWRTASEVNNDYFALEKSYDGINFFELTRIPGAGNANYSVNYSFNDVDTYSGVIYYCLKQVDYDGATTLYDMKAVQCDPTDFDISNIHLTNNQLAFNVISSYEDNLSIFLYDYTGRLILQEPLIIHEGVYQFEQNNLQLSPGMYLLTIVGKETSESHKLTTIHR